MTSICLYHYAFFWPKYSPPSSSHHIFFLQPVLALLVQSSVIHCIIVPFGQELNVSIFPARQSMSMVLDHNVHCVLFLNTLCLNEDTLSIFKLLFDTVKCYEWHYQILSTGMGLSDTGSTTSSPTPPLDNTTNKKCSHTFHGSLVLCVLLGSLCLLSWRQRSLRLWWDLLLGWSETAGLLCGKLAPYSHWSEW